MNAYLLFVILEFILFALPLLVLFARLSFHYSRLFDASPTLAKAFQAKFAKVPSTDPGARPDTPYRPLDQIRFLAEARGMFGPGTHLNALLSTVMLDLRLTLAWLAVGVLLVLSTVIALFS